MVEIFTHTVFPRLVLHTPIPNFRPRYLHNGGILFNENTSVRKIKPRSFERCYIRLKIFSSCEDIEV